MLDLFEEPFTRKKPVPQKLTDYGFSADGALWRYGTSVLGGEFSLSVTVSENGAVGTDLIETATGEPYILYKTNAQGSFVGEVRQAVLSVLSNIAEQCFEPAVFKTAQAQATIDYVRRAYGRELEFLWRTFPDNAVWRRADTGKWFGAILTTRRNRLGLDGDEKIEIIDLRTAPNQMDALLKDPRYFPGWHMSKKHWFTVILDGSVDDAELFRRIDESYTLAVK